MNDAITRDSSALVLVTWLPNRRDANASVATPTETGGPFPYLDMPTLSPGTSTPQAPAVIPATSDAIRPLRAHPQRRGTTGKIATRR